MASAAGAADLRSTNVSVTAINVDNTDYYKTNSTSSINGVTVNITESGPSVERSSLNEQHSGVLTQHSRGKDTINVNVITEHSTSRSTLNRHSDSDSEVAQIDFQSTNVNLRPKNGEGKKPEIPRPMSWEGELSDGESTMCIDEDSIHLIENSQYIIPENLSTVCNISAKHQSSQQPFTPLSSNPTAVRLKQPAPPPPPVGGYSLHSTPSHSPLLSQRPLGHRQLNVPPTPSPDSAIHSAYSVFSSPSQSPITQRHVTSSLSRNNSDASHSSCCSYSSVSVSPTQQFSPTHSPIQGRHTQHIHSSPLHHNAIYRSIQDIEHASLYGTPNHRHSNNELNGETDIGQLDEIDDKTGISQTTLQNTQGISRQQLINSPCPICGDKISGFHYGIFSCESCKGFFKRTVQNRKNYVCLRGALCPVTVTTRKKCPACRFDKCLQCGMKLEAIREDRTRGGRSTYQCSYSIPPSLAGLSDLQASPGSLSSVKLEPTDISNSSTSYTSQKRLAVPSLLQEIMDVEHLWHYNEVELTKLSNERSLGRTSTSGGSSNPVVGLSTNPLLMNTKLAANAGDETNSDFLQNLCNIADHRLYKIVKWCKSLPLFKNISIDDQICLLINSWCELLLFSCCFRSISTPGEIKVSLGKSINLAQAREMGLQACIERMLNFTEHLRRLRVDKYEYVAMKVIVLLTSDASELREPEKVRASQEKALQALQAYTLAHYPDSPAKFGELLLRIPDLQRTCQVGKEMLSIKSKEGEGPSFNLLMELLRGDH